MILMACCEILSRELEVLTLKRKLSWESMTPFGMPVVPLV